MNRNSDASEEPGDRVRLSGRCVVTGKPYSVVVPLSGAIDYFERVRNIAEAFPDLPKPEREFLISGTSPEGWTQLFGPTTAVAAFEKTFEAMSQPDNPTRRFNSG